MAEYFTQGSKKKDLPKSIITGRQVNRIQLTMGYKNLTIKVGFQPGGLYRLLGIPLKEFLLDEAFDSADVLDKDIRFVNEQLQEAATYDSMVYIVERFLLQKKEKLREKLPIDEVLSQLIQKGGLMNIDDISKQACVSVRQLERQFQQRIGIPPKHFARLTRFSKAWVLKENNIALKWTHIAYTCGYFDQMHLIRDFKDFAGVTPSVIEAEFNNSPYLLRNQLYT
jgi:AraC-like DNA-binding protein